MEQPNEEQLHQGPGESGEYKKAGFLPYKPCFLLHPFPTPQREYLTKSKTTSGMFSLALILVYTLVVTTKNSQFRRKNWKPLPLSWLCVYLDQNEPCILV